MLDVDIVATTYFRWNSIHGKKSSDLSMFHKYNLCPKIPTLKLTSLPIIMIRQLSLLVCINVVNCHRLALLYTVTKTLHNKISTV